MSLTPDWWSWLLTAETLANTPCLSPAIYLWEGGGIRSKPSSNFKSNKSFRAQAFKSLLLLSKVLLDLDLTFSLQIETATL